MAEYSSEDANVAGRLVRRLLGRGDDELEPVGLSVADVEEDTIKFRKEIEILEEAGIEAPALNIGGLGDWIPISLTLLLGGSPLPRFFFQRGFRGRLGREYLRSAFQGYAEKGEIIFVPARLALDRFSEKATDFLATRIAGLRNEEFLTDGSPPGLRVFQRLGGIRILVPGCSFTVTTNNLGLRVFWSGAYYVSGNYFGHPSFPVTGVLQAGTYIFGVDGGAYGNTIQWDHSKCTLPGRPSVHLNF